MHVYLNYLLSSLYFHCSVSFYYCHQSFDCPIEVFIQNLQSCHLTSLIKNVQFYNHSFQGHSNPLLSPRKSLNNLQPFSSFV